MISRGQLALACGLRLVVGVVLGGGLVGTRAQGGELTGSPRVSAPFVGERGPESFATRASSRRYPIALVRGPTRLYDRPRGRLMLRIAGRTEWRSPRWLPIVRGRGEWLAVTVPELRNGYVGWIWAGDAVVVRSVSWALYADRSRRRLTVKNDGKTVRVLSIAVGRPGHPTPLGRYAVTDRLHVRDPGSPYGCCVLALSGHQTRLPPGWPGGDRLAIHATSNPASVGAAASLGCMRVFTRDAAWLVRTIPLGTPVFVRP